MHSPWPGFAAYVLAAHSLQESLLSPEVVPGLQSSHWERPGVAAKLPFVHGVCSVEPVVAKKPAMAAVHCEASERSVLSE